MHTSAQTSAGLLLAVLSCLAVAGAGSRGVTGWQASSPLGRAAAKGDTASVKRELAAPAADVNGRSGQKAASALHIAARLGHADVVAVLLAAHANPALRNADGLTPADLATDPATRELLCTADSQTCGAIPADDPLWSTAALPFIAVWSAVVDADYSAGLAPWIREARPTAASLVAPIPNPHE